VSGWLRHRLGYDGVVVTDDLEMGAVTRHYGFGESVRQVLRAEVDLALICHTAALVEEARDRMARRIATSEKVRRRHHRSLDRILRLKSQYLAAV
jgi:beta-N-acetylhexosaminidase